MNFNSVCRTCLSRSSLKSIYSLQSDYKSFHKAIFIVTGVKVAINDGLPQKICLHCLKQVNHTLKFRKMCKKADNTIRGLKNRVSLSNSTDHNNIEYSNNSMTDFVKELSVTNDEYEIDNLDGATFDDDEPLKNFLEHTVNTENNEAKVITLDIVTIGRESNNNVSNGNSIDLLSNYNRLQHTNNAKDLECVGNINKIEKFNDTDTNITGNSDGFQKKQNNNIGQNAGKSNLTTENMIGDDNIFLNKTATDFGSLYDMDLSDPTGKRVKCRLCLKNLSIRSIDVHLSKSHPGSDPRRVKCQLCDCFIMRKRLLRHRLQMHGSGTLECRFCKRNFDEVGLLTEHVVTCIERFKRKGPDLSRELTECDVCKEKMQKGSLRRHHAVKHAGLRPVCEHCGRSFGNNLRLEEHCRAKHGYEKFSCTYCDFRCASGMGMKNHERRHRGEKPYVCEACGAKFHATYLLAQHKKSHRTERMFKCNTCASRFKTSNARRAHVRAVHAGRARARARTATSESDKNTQ